MNVTACSAKPCGAHGACAASGTGAGFLCACSPCYNGRICQIRTISASCGAALASGSATEDSDSVKVPVWLLTLALAVCACASMTGVICLFRWKRSRAGGGENGWRRRGRGRCMDAADQGQITLDWLDQHISHADRTPEPMVTRGSPTANGGDSSGEESQSTFAGSESTAGVPPRSEAATDVSEPMPRQHHNAAAASSSLACDKP